MATNKMELDLQTDLKQLRSFIENRIDDYAGNEGLGPGERDAAIQMVTTGFNIEDGGRVSFVVDTRHNAEIDGTWTSYSFNEKNVFSFPHWQVAQEAINDGQKVFVFRPDGSEMTLQASDGDKNYYHVLGGVILDLMFQLREDETLARLPLKNDAFMVVEEWQSRYFWPHGRDWRWKARILKSTDN